MGKLGVLFTTTLASYAGGALGGYLASSLIHEKHRVAQVVVGILGAAVGASTFGAIAATIVSDGVDGAETNAAMGPDLGMGSGEVHGGAQGGGHIASTLGPRGRNEEGKA